MIADIHILLRRHLSSGANVLVNLFNDDLRLTQTTRTFFEFFFEKTRPLLRLRQSNLQILQKRSLGPEKD